MNLISQNCLAAEIYKLTNCAYQNPFASTVIQFDSLKYLIENWDNIDFDNPKVELTEDNYPIIVLNEKCRIEYVHYRQSNEFDIPRKEGAYIFYKDCISFVLEKYNRRLERMKTNAEKPMFCICNFKTIYKNSIYTQEQLAELSHYENVKILVGVEELEPNIAARRFYATYLAKSDKIEIYVVGSSKNKFLLNDIRKQYVIDKQHEGDNIDKLNPWYCELTGLYYLWKHSNASIVGLEHYCRYFTNDKHQLLSTKEINQLLLDNDVIMRYWDFTKYSKYKCAWEYLSPINLGYIIRLLEWAKSDERGYIMQCLKTLTYFGQCNMFICKKEIIDEYCNWFFTLAKNFTQDDLDRYPRGIGYVSEFILSAWLLMKGYKIGWYPVDEYNKELTRLNGRF